jgi:hypothetical protein
MGKDPKLPRNFWHSWWIPGGIDTCSKILRDPKLPRNSWHSWCIPREIDSFSKNVRPKITQEFLAFLVDSWRN